ncbi:hypothetical protein C8R45DRAFT_1107515 [Mycena sanguinolenta]|nr:hypothetical protein C8R45DRAFT_1107515 [Mycena sanguinolenta]
MSDQQYIVSSGTNSQGNHWTSYKDGSFSYKNADGSTYVDDGKGSSTYTSPSGHQVKKYPTSVAPAQTQPRLPQDYMISQSSGGGGGGGGGGSDSSDRSCCCIQ